MHQRLNSSRSILGGMSNYKKAISTAKAAIVIVVLVVVIAAGVYFATSNVTPSVTMSSTEAATSTAAAMPQTLVIDDANWPVHNLNALYQFIYVPWPWWLEHTVYQTLVVPDLNAEFGQGKLVWAPDLATDWTVSSDSTTYTYNLRQNVTFSSGNPFNAYQVWTEMYIWSLSRRRVIIIAAPGAYLVAFPTRFSNT